MMASRTSSMPSPDQQRRRRNPGFHHTLRRLGASTKLAGGKGGEVLAMYRLHFQVFMSVGLFIFLAYGVISGFSV
jgi:hypothetical protein